MMQLHTGDDGLQERLEKTLRVVASVSSDAGQVLDDCLTVCREASLAGYAERVIPAMQKLKNRHKNDFRCAEVLGLALREEQRYGDADEVFSQAVAKGADGPAILFAHAQTRFELGKPAAELFERAHATSPDNLDIIRNKATALAVEGDVAGADETLCRVLSQKPDWLDGHKGLATLRWRQGDKDRFADSYQAASISQPQNTALWMAWFGLLCQTKDWPGAADILDRAEKALGAVAPVVAGRFYLATESGDLMAAAPLYHQTAHLIGDTINLCRIRFLLRAGRTEEAHNVAVPLLQTPSATVFWPYASLIWRLLSDPRAGWVDRPDTLIRLFALPLSKAKLAELETLLRSLHTVEEPYLEQSIRGGSQTDRSVLLRAEPILQEVRRAWVDVLRAYIDDLRPPERHHPLLDRPRKKFLLDGSWSVRLQPGGYNVPHTHPRGWISSVLYVSVPPKDDRGEPPAGHIAFGAPPVELGLDLSPVRTIEPQPGQVVVFPSTTWHSTIPFDDGDRLVIALDVRPPLY